MFEVTRVEQNRLDIKMSGKLDSEHMKKALDDLVTQAEGIEHGRMCFEVVDFHLPSLGAISLEFSRLPAMLKFMGKFDRAAVLTDKTWLKMVSEIEGVLYPGLDIKAFSREQKLQADAWLSGS